MTTVLLTGFEPFGGGDVNSSWQAVRAMAERWPALPSAVTHGALLRVAEVPCVFGGAGEHLAGLMAEHEPDVVVCTGQAEGRAAVTPERVAINVDDATEPDNAGHIPEEAANVPDGPAAYFATIPVRASVAALRAAGVPARVSNTAGTFVCNHLFYRLMHLISTRRPATTGGFVHVPCTPAQAAGGTVPSLSVETTATGLLHVVATALAARTGDRAAAVAG